MEESDQMINLQQTMIQIQQQNPQFGSFLYGSPEGQKFLEAFTKVEISDQEAREFYNQGQYRI